MSQKQKIIDVSAIAEDSSLLPQYASEHAAGADVRAAIDNDIILLPGESVLVPTGLRVAIPEGFEIQVRPRSGLALRDQVTVLNTPGTIDADYRGEIGVILINHGKKPFTITSGMRIAQFVLTSVARANYVIESELVGSARGEGGFGHTGLH